ncbi:MAG: hypothetical protein JWP29_3556 [Rhodoferax sp.]|nr:hypothetical protein [Rhodoferax sp.]
MKTLTAAFMAIAITSPAYSQSPPIYARIPQDAQRALYDRAYNALVERLGNGVAMGARYAVQVDGKLFVCGAGHFGNGLNKFTFIYAREEDGVALLGDDPDYKRVEQILCHPQG